jgi:hypothetical protein
VRPIAQLLIKYPYSIPGIMLGWQCGMVRSNAAAACNTALLCGSIHAHFAAFNAVPHAASACRMLPHAVSPLILNKIYLLMIITYYLESRFINELCTTGH